MGWNQSWRQSSGKRKNDRERRGRSSVVGDEGGGGFLEPEKRGDWRIDKRRSFMAQ